MASDATPPRALRPDVHTEEMNDMRASWIAWIFTTMAGCFPMMQPATGTPGGTTSGTTSAAPMPMTNEQALAYAQAHRDPNMGVVHAVNRLAVPVCRIVLLSVADRASWVDQAGPHDPHRGSLDPTDEPLLAPGENTLMTFGKSPSGAADMAVTAFGCERPDKHFGMYVTDENKVVFQRTVAIADQGTVVLAAQ
jgi:hypothetical protein